MDPLAATTAMRETFVKDFELLYCDATNGYSHDGHADMYHKWCFAAHSLAGLGLPPAGQFPVFVQVAQLYLCYKAIKVADAKEMTWPVEEWPARMIARLS